MGITHIYLAIQTLVVGRLILLATEGYITVAGALITGAVLYTIYFLAIWFVEIDLFENVRNLFNKKK